MISRLLIGASLQKAYYRVELFAVPKSTAVPALKLILTDPEGQAVNLQTAAVRLLVHSSADTDLEVKSIKAFITSQWLWNVQWKLASIGK